MVRDVRRFERAGTGSALEIALMQKLLVRAQYRQARNAEVDGETPGRRDPLSRPESAIEDSMPKSVVDLSEYRNANAAIDRKMQRCHRESGIGNRESGTDYQS